MWTKGGLHEAIPAVSRSRCRGGDPHRLRWRRRRWDDHDRERSVGPQHQLVRRELLLHGEVEGPDRGRQGQRRGDPSGHHLVRALRAVRPAIPAEGVRAGRIQVLRLLDQQRPGPGGPGAGAGAGRHHQGRDGPDHGPAEQHGRLADPELRAVEGRQGHQLRPRDLHRHQHLLRQLRQRAGGRAHRQGLRPVRLRLGRQERPGLRVGRRPEL